VVGKTYDHRAGGNCEPLIKSPKFSTFRHFDISTTGNPKDRGAGSLHCESLNHETPKERALRNFGILVTGSSKDRGARPLHRDSPNHETLKE
jgi:hypothetical protein